MPGKIMSSSHSSGIRLTKGGVDVASGTLKTKNGCVKIFRAEVFCGKENN